MNSLYSCCPLPQAPSSSLKSPLSCSPSKPKTATATANGNEVIAMPLPRRAKVNSQDPGKKTTKEALWTLVSLSTPSINAEALFTPADREGPVGCDPVASSSGPRKKKACKGCTCGLAEIEKVEGEAGQAELAERLKVTHSLSLWLLSHTSLPFLSSIPTSFPTVLSFLYLLFP